MTMENIGMSVEGDTDSCTDPVAPVPVFTLISSGHRRSFGVCELMLAACSAPRFPVRRSLFLESVTLGFLLIEQEPFYPQYGQEYGCIQSYNICVGILMKHRQNGASCSYRRNDHVSPSSLSKTNHPLVLEGVRRAGRLFGCDERPCPDAESRW